jgi:hypothetical protein
MSLFCPGRSAICHRPRNRPIESLTPAVASIVAEISESNRAG